eukprot:1496994-Rhodomonas_salina.1
MSTDLPFTTTIQSNLYYDGVREPVPKLPNPAHYPGTGYPGTRVCIPPGSRDTIHASLLFLAGDFGGGLIARWIVERLGVVSVFKYSSHTFLSL